MWCLLPAPGAAAHAFLIDSNPADGTTLSTAPKQLRMDFSESVVLDALTIDIVDGSGRHLRPLGVRLLGGDEKAADTEAPSEIVAALPTLAPNVYRVSWATLSSDDLHRTSGVLVFGVGRAVTGSAFTEPFPRWEEVLLRAAIFLSLAAALGGLLAVRLFRLAGATGVSTGGIRTCRRIAVVGGLAGIAAGLVLLVDQLLVSGAPLQQLLSGSIGFREILREGGFLVLAVAATRSRPSVVRTACIVVGSALAAFGTALMGHSSGGTGAAITRVGADALHLLTAATWSGALLVVMILVVPMMRTDRRPEARNFLRHFALPAAACFTTMVVSGIYLSSGVVGSVDAALSTFYGRTLMIKVMVVGLIAVLALRNHLAVRRAGSWGNGPRAALVRAEAIGAVVVLLLAAVLTGSQPAMEPQFIASPVAPTVPLIDLGVADLQETLAVRPNVPGSNVVLVDVFDVRRPALAPIRAVLVEIGSDETTLGAPVTASPLEQGHWSVVATLSRPGRIAVRVTVQRPGLLDVTTRYSWTVGGAPAVRPAAVSNAPLAGPLADIALALLLLLVAAVLFSRWTRRTRWSRARAQITECDRLEPLLWSETYDSTEELLMSAPRGNTRHP
ncbi:copper transport protein [Nakamurella sp. UYEF19]|uniref:copper resistance CopC/CopD family protein n=1 Tax=Nakamurella sp. UYEF19 TaxID=1756392 RepID=UPI0033937D56